MPVKESVESHVVLHQQGIWYLQEKNIKVDSIVVTVVSQRSEFLFRQNIFVFFKHTNRMNELTKLLATYNFPWGGVKKKSKSVT